MCYFLYWLVLQFWDPNKLTSLLPSTVWLETQALALSHSFFSAFNSIQSGMNFRPLWRVQSLRPNRSEALLLWDLTQNQKPPDTQHAVEHTAWANHGHDLQELLRIVRIVIEWMGNKADSVQYSSYVPVITVKSSTDHANLGWECHAYLCLQTVNLQGALKDFGFIPINKRNSPASEYHS